ncbi:MAG TPA: hypothetical protein VGS19_01160 [Streptosporangiaceae bacterium]|nr:hypothetical protein [Streptosporangiaceae bacterium]
MADAPAAALAQVMLHFAAWPGRQRQVVDLGALDTPLRGADGHPTPPGHGRDLLDCSGLSGPEYEAGTLSPQYRYGVTGWR